MWVAFQGTKLCLRMRRCGGACALVAVRITAVQVDSIVVSIVLVPAVRGAPKITPVVVATAGVTMSIASPLMIMAAIVSLVVAIPVIKVASFSVCLVQ